MAGLWDRWRRRDEEDASAPETTRSGGDAARADGDADGHSRGSAPQPGQRPTQRPGQGDPQVGPREDEDQGAHSPGSGPAPTGAVGTAESPTVVGASGGSRTPSGRVSPEAAPSAPLLTPAPVTRERLAASMTRRGYHYLTDTAGDLCGLWSYRFFSFYIVRGSVLQIRGRWTRQADLTRLWEMLAFTDAWNTQRPNPKCYVRVNDDGRVHVVTEVSVPIAAGLSDEQLDHHIAVGLMTGSAVFDELDRRYPDPVLTPREEDS